MKKIIHELKTINPYFTDMWLMKKRFEVRFNDRNFKIGEILNLKEYDPITKKYSDRSIWCEIIYILDNPDYVKEGYVILGIKEFDRKCYWLDDPYKI